jgi:ABC-2 type transport system permease protein
MSAIWAVALKELRQIRRDRRTLLILLFIPAFFLFLYGYALNFDIHHVALGVQDRDGSPDSRALVARFVESTYFDLVATVRSESDADQLMDRGTVRALLVIPETFSDRLRAGEAVDVQVVLNGDNANTATTVLGYVTAVLREEAAAIAASVRTPTRGTGTADGSTAGSIGPPPRVPPGQIVLEPRVWYNPELRSTLFLVPGLIAYIATITAVLSTALSIVKEKELGTMEQVRMAPISTPAFVLGKTLPYLILSQASAMLIIVTAMALFDMPMRGSWLALSAVLALFLVGGVGTGLFVSTIADTQQVALQTSLLIAFLPTMILSGFIFPISSMPVFIQYVTRLVPARYFLVALRGIVLKGATLSSLWSPVLALSVFAVFILGAASVRLARR